MRRVTFLHIFTVVVCFSHARISEGIDSMIARPKEKPQSMGTTFIFSYLSSHFSASDMEFLSVLVSNQNTSQSARIVITSSYPTFIPISVTVLPNQVTRISINPVDLQAQYPNIDTGMATIENKGLQLTSSIPVTVYTDNENINGYSSDSMLVLPVCQLGRRYETINDQTPIYQTNSMFSIVATEDNTIVRFFLNATGVWVNHTLNRLQVLTYSHTIYFLTATKIETDKPVAVITGVLCGIGIDDNNICDHETVMLVPSDSWGTQFAFVTFAGSVYNEFEMVADQDTKVYNDNNLINNMPANTYLTFNTSNSYIWTDKPVEVVQVGKRSEGTIQTGAPFFVHVPSSEQFVSGPVLFSTYGNFDSNAQHYVRVTTMLASTGHIAIDDYTPTSLQYKRVGNSNFYYFNQQISPGHHKVVPQSSANSYSAIVYGFGDFTGYGFAAGLNLPAINGACATRQYDRH